MDETQPEAVVTAPEVETIGKVLETEEAKPEPKSVPEAAFLELKNSNKELKKELKALQKSIEDGASKEEVSEDFDDIAAEWDLDPKFVKKFGLALEKRAEARADERLSNELKPIKAKEQAERVEKVFAEHYDKALAEMPEYANIINRSVIKSLSLDPANQNKTFAQLIEETYSGAIRGKHTLEPTTPRGGKSAEPIDYKRAQKDQAYRLEILADPETKKEYNSTLIERLSTTM